ncbi:oleate delta-12 desaturase [Piedraia hortae CBS 480.64]|uniref:Oleate delta-12 desaturase n=1 Tax=Piedraia hortae CBS 480.64 TaxID=1314780 RepID=A0A6A7BPM4_9PEZI|nr:oleate delta-12 desaturase [Piedraia hortae CBS 480.64]
MSTVPSSAAFRRSVANTVPSATTSATASTIPSSSEASPSGSPRPASSATSLSSLAADEFPSKKKLVNTYGDEFTLPNYTIKQIRDAIPKHCYERSGLRGLAYVARDILSLAVTFMLFNTFCTPQYVPWQPARAVLWTIYTFVQGLFGTGLWVLAHECGHQAFSPSKTLNDTVGWFCHSALLVPYFSWKFSHRAHHKATGNMERDMVFVPRTREEQASRMGWLMHEMHELLEETPIWTALHLISQQLVGWPYYLVANVTGHDNHERQHEGKGKGKHNGDFSVNHFFTSSPLYDRKEEHLILLSDLGLVIVGTILYLIGQKYGLANLAVWYIAPYLWVNHWLVAITYLQHTDPTLPHYTGDAWSYTRGAAATIDREFGFIGRHLFHGIIETHVLHHYVCTIPFYHADEATEAIKPIMGQHYRSNTKGGPLGFMRALWEAPRWCQWVEPNEGAMGDDKKVLFFRNRNGLGVTPARMSEK